TRFPTMLASVRREPPPSVTCPDPFRAAGGERSRTGVNETRTETRPGSRTHRVARFRGLRTAIHYRPRVYRTWAERQSAFAGERLRTGVNEARTEARPRPAAWHACLLPGRCPVSVEVISWALNLAP